MGQLGDVKAAREKAKGASEKTRFDLLLTLAAAEAEDWTTAKEATARLVKSEPDWIWRSRITRWRCCTLKSGAPSMRRRPRG